MTQPKMRQLKVCGMKHRDNIQQIATLNPQYLGFIFYEKSPRFFSGVIPALPKSIKKTGVFVDASLDTVLDTAKSHDLQAVQLHGDESPEFCKRICEETSLELIKAFSVSDPFDFSALEPYLPYCTYFLFDTKGQVPGGTGLRFCWTLLDDYPFTKAYFLSGGIGLDAIDKLEQFIASPASSYCEVIDINSKFEYEPGLKNYEGIKRFKSALPFV